ncbi:MAG: D-amino-acid transaminase [Hyphomicrobiales bacterium]|nr:D-amino-acid transaminase [Hyphomicrobiales bacterium]
MSRIAYVNGRYRPWRDAMVHVEDRGYQFADAVYEVCEVRGGRLVDRRRHMARLERSLATLRIAMPMSPGALGVILRETIRRNRVVDGLVYLQVSRGVAKRDHYFPSPAPAPALVVTARALNMAALEATAEKGIGAITLPDNRWGRVDIKSVGLLPNVLARQAAYEQGAREAFFVDRDGNITEGASSNAWIVTRDGKLLTRPADTAILRGITRDVLINTIAAQGLQFDERAFSVAEAREAREIFMTSATQTVMPIVSLDGKPVGDGRPGPISKALRRAFREHAEWV